MSAHTDAPVVKDEVSQRPVPSIWRPVFREIVKAFVARDYRLSAGVPNVAPISPDTAAQIESYIQDYGETLVHLPDEAWDTSVMLWVGSRWEVLVDLWTQAEGRSDMILSVHVSESRPGFAFDVQMVYVP